MSESSRSGGRMQQAIAVALIFAASAWVAYASFSVDDPLPYLFPQLISIAMVGLAGVALLSILHGSDPTDGGISLKQFGLIAPAIILMLLYVFVLAPKLGFYTGAAVAFFAIYTLYDPNSHLKPTTWLVRLAVTVGFILLIYLVFAVGLQVQSPRGLLL